MLLDWPGLDCTNLSPLIFRAEQYEETSWLTNQTRIIRDYSMTVSSLPQFYLLPHLWSGVLGRMVSGYRCVVADQEVSDQINRWRHLVRSKHQLNFTTQTDLSITGSLNFYSPTEIYL